MTKAETIFENIRKEARYIIRSWGVDGSKARNFACHFDTEGTDGFVYQRTVNAVNKQLDKYVQQIRLWQRHGLMTDEKTKEEAEIIRLISTGIQNGQLFVNELKAI